MKIRTQSTIVLGVAALGLVAASTAQASFSWRFDSNPQYGTCDEGPYPVGNSCQATASFNGDNITVTATGWASSTSSASSGLEKATLNVWDGLAVQSQGESYSSAPEHATDNSGKKESILFDFGSNVTLSVDSITHGWHQDADFSLLAYTGSAPFNSNDLEGQSYVDLLNNGWELVSNSFYGSGASTGTDITAPDDSSYYYSVTDENGNTVPFNNGTSSSYWLVAALNDAYWNGSSGYIGNDYFKLKYITGDVSSNPPPPPPPPPGVSEPATLGLLGLGMLAMRRRFKARA